MSLNLRNYQIEGVADVCARFSEGARRVLYQALTGSGKTVLFSFVVQNAVARGNRVAIIGHRQEIVDQINTALGDIDVAHGIIAAGHPETRGPVQVASVATLIRRLDRVRDVDLLVIDEAHHAVAGTWRKIIEGAPSARILGCTATPERLDGKGLGDIFDVLVLGPTVGDLIPTYLAPFTAYAPARNLNLSGIKTRLGDYAVDALADIMSNTMVIGSAVEEYSRLCPGAPAIAFCVDIALVAARFAAAGYKAAHVDGHINKDERRELIKSLATGDVQVLTNCGLISEGLDVPGVVAAILQRPTKSLALYLQQVGRALRPAPGKAKALILDHSGNAYRFGLADAPRSWSLDGWGKARSGAAAVCRCRQCGALNPITARHSDACGAQLREPRPPIPRVEVRSGQLIEIDRLQAMTYRRAPQWAGESEDRVRLVARVRGYKRGWVWHRLRELRDEDAA